jgi:predicted 5'-methylthioadenosine/S-adenosylhomocysteine nucleosidase
VLVVAATERELAHVRRFDTFCCGIGPVEAALNTGRALAERHPDGILHIGIAGSRMLPQLSLVLGSVSVFEDAQSPLVPTRAAPDAELLARLRAELPDAHVVPIGTSARVGGTNRCDVEAMEGFSVLRACEIAGVPAVELRVISNSPEEADRSKWSFEPAFEALGAALDRLDVV